jgi:hypothetical protein
MAVINLQTILGSDTLNNLRITYNQNFQTIQNAINNIENYLNTTPTNGDLNIGNILIKKGSNPVTSILFKNEASSQIDGDLNVQGNFSLSANLSVSGNSVLNGDLTLGGLNKSLNIGTSTNNVSLNLVKGPYNDIQFATTSPFVLTGPSPFTINVNKNMRIIIIDLNGVSGSYTIKMQPDTLNPPTSGQRIFIKFIGNASGTPTITIDTTTSPTIFDSTVLSSDIQCPPSDILKQFLEIVNISPTSTPSFHIINAHKSIVF